MVAASGSVLSLVLVLLFIPNPEDTDRRRRRKKEETSSSVMDLREIAKAASVPGVGGLLLVKLVCGVPIGVLQSMFSGG